jgi:AcrR family transcriptional regulator
MTTQVTEVPAIISPATDPDPERPLRRPRRGRPRNQEANRAILEAATELLATRGLSAMSIEDVAARAGVGKATIYRRWSSKGSLALDAFLAAHKQELPPPDTGSFRTDLEAALRDWVRSVTQTSAGSILAGLTAEIRQDPELAAQWGDRVVKPIRVTYNVIVERAISRGEIRPDADANVVLDLLFGSAVYRLLHGQGQVDAAFRSQVVSILAAGLSPDPGAATSH